MNGSEGMQESKLWQALVTQGCIPEPRKGRGTHALTCTTTSPNFYRKGVFGKLDSETMRHADLTLEREILKNRGTFCLFLLSRQCRYWMYHKHHAVA